mmetsp:Transcript_126070/g.251714  ORF Transcript_126070/g.251714 Transcript_126070/m.251714 type:complete len:201 (-) Transcript_126070:408-1010(-)
MKYSRILLIRELYLLLLLPHAFVCSLEPQREVVMEGCTAQSVEVKLGDPVSKTACRGGLYNATQAVFSRRALATCESDEHVGLGVGCLEHVILKFLEESKEELKEVSVPCGEEAIQKVKEHMERQVVNAKPGKPFLYEGLRHQANPAQVILQCWFEKPKTDIAIHSTRCGFPTPIARQKIRMVVEDCQNFEGCCRIEEEH